MAIEAAPEEKYDKKAIEVEEQKVKEEGKRIYNEIRNKALKLETQLMNVHKEIAEKEKKLKEIVNKAKTEKELNTEEELEKLKEIEELLERSKQITERQKTLNDSSESDDLLLAEVAQSIENKEN